MDGADGWSDIAAEWSELWGDFADPVHHAIIREAGITNGTTVLDVGCGSGEFIRTLERWGADPTGIDPAPGMVALAGPRARLGDFDPLPWPNDTFDVVTAINALQFADDTLDALAEAKRVTKPGGMIAIANWADAALNDLDVIERAIAEPGDETQSDDDLRLAGGLERLFADAGVELVASGVVHLPWTAPDDTTLVRGVLLGEDDEVRASLTDEIVAAAAPFKNEQGYELRNAFRFVVGVAS